MLLLARVIGLWSLHIITNDGCRPPILLLLRLHGPERLAHMLLATIAQLFLFFLVDQVGVVLWLRLVCRGFPHKLAVHTLNIHVSIAVCVVAREVVWRFVDRIDELLLRRVVGFASVVSTIIIIVIIVIIIV